MLLFGKFVLMFIVAMAYFWELSAANLYVPAPCDTAADCQQYIRGEGCDAAFCRCPDPQQQTCPQRECAYDWGDQGMGCEVRRGCSLGICSSNFGTCHTVYYIGNTSCTSPDPCEGEGVCHVLQESPLRTECRRTGPPPCDDSDPLTLDVCVPDATLMPQGYRCINLSRDHAQVTPVNSTQAQPVTPATGFLLPNSSASTESVAPIVAIVTRAPEAVASPPLLSMEYLGVRSDDGRRFEGRVPFEPWTHTQEPLDDPPGTRHVYESMGSRAIVDVHEGSQIADQGNSSSRTEGLVAISVSGAPPYDGLGFSAVFCIATSPAPLDIILLGNGSASLVFEEPWSAFVQVEERVWCDGDPRAASVAFGRGGFCPDDKVEVVVRGQCDEGARSFVFDPDLRVLADTDVTHLGGGSSDGSRPKDVPTLLLVISSSAVGLLICLSAFATVYLCHRAGARRRKREQMMRNMDHISKIREAVSDSGSFSEGSGLPGHSLQSFPPFVEGDDLNTSL